MNEIGMFSTITRCFQTITGGCAHFEQDAQIVAIVQLHGATLATRDIADFRNCGIDVIDPWAPDR
jgi:hypothetical protein